MTAQQTLCFLQVFLLLAHWDNSKMTKWPWQHVTLYLRRLTISDIYWTGLRYVILLRTQNTPPEKSSLSSMRCVDHLRCCCLFYDAWSTMLTVSDSWCGRTVEVDYIWWWSNSICWWREFWWRPKISRFPNCPGRISSSQRGGETKRETERERERAVDFI